MSTMNKRSTSSTNSSVASSPVKKHSTKAKTASVEMEVEYKWLKNELNSAIGTIETEKTVNSELNDVLISMETQLVNLRDGKMIDLGELRSGDQALISQTILAKKNRMTMAIGRLQEELELVNRQNKDLQERQSAMEKNIVEVEEKYATCTVDLMDAQNSLQSAVLAHKVKCCNYEDEVAYHYRLLNHSSDAITKLCGNANRYVTYYKNVRCGNAVPVKGVSSLAEVIAKSDFDLIEHKCQILGFKSLYKTMNGLYRSVVHSAMRRWVEATVASRVRADVLRECSEHHEGLLSEVSASARVAHESEIRDLKHHYEQIIIKQQAQIGRVEASREQAVHQLYCNSGENVLDSNITHNLNIRRSKLNFKNSYFEKWLSLAFKSYLCKHERSCEEIAELKDQLRGLDGKYQALLNESASNSDDFDRERRKHAMHVCVTSIARRRYFYSISIAFRSWIDQLHNMKQRERVNALLKDKAELLESCEALSEELTNLVGVHDSLVKHQHYSEVSNGLLSRKHQNLRARLLKREMLDRWKFHHYGCIVLKYKCKAENYPNLRRLAQSTLAPPPPVVTIPLPLPSVPPSPEIVIVPTPRPPSPPKRRSGLFVSTPMIVQKENPDVVTYRYRR